MAALDPGAPGAPGAPAGVPDASVLGAPWDTQPLSLGQVMAQPSQSPPAVPGGGVDQLTSLMPQLSLNDPTQAAQASANLAAMMWQMAQQNPAFANTLGAMAPSYGAPMMPPPPVPGANIVPPLSVRVDGLMFEYQLTDDDVRKVFSRYGEVKTVMVDREGTYATVLFDKPENAVNAQRDLNGKQLAGMSGAFLRVDFPPPAPYDPMASLPPAPMPGYPPNAMLGMPPTAFPGMPPQLPQNMGMPLSPAGRPKKYSCKLEVGIENDGEFRVGRRVIQVARQIWQDPIFQQQDGKTRLRGKGIGGPHEAEEPLALCISCRDQGSFDRAVAYAEEEMRKIHKEYKAFCEQYGKEVPELSIKISKNSTHSAMPSLLPGGFGSDGFGSNSNAAPKPDPPRGEPPPGAPNEAEIEGLIEERNEARKAANFKRSDEVRDYLMSRGVVLMDEKGARGNLKGMQVTKWRYWRP